MVYIALKLNTDFQIKSLRQLGNMKISFIRSILWL